MRDDHKVVVGTMEVRKVKYSVSITVSGTTTWQRGGNAQFSMEVFGKELYANSWEDLYKKAMVASKQAAVKVNVPLLRWARERSWRPVTVEEAEREAMEKLDREE